MIDIERGHKIQFVVIVSFMLACHDECLSRMCSMCVCIHPCLSISCSC